MVLVWWGWLLGGFAAGMGGHGLQQAAALAAAVEYLMQVGDRDLQAARAGAESPSLLPEGLQRCRSGSDFAR